jgi:L-threonylcarbamoyladenylate synthase
MPARIYKPTPRNLRLLGAMLRRGGLVAIPTETVYGLAADALDSRACRRIFSAKRRPADDPLIVHVLGLREAEELAEFNAAARVLARHFWPGPLTLVLPRKKNVPDIVTSGQETVALRSPQHPLARKILQLSGRPLAAPSANPFGYISPTTAAHVRAGLGGCIKAILDGGPCAVGVESTIVDLSQPRRLRLLRPGSIPADELNAALERNGLVTRISTRSRKSGVLAPGLLAQHYSPHTPLAVVARISSSLARSVDGATALIFQWRPAVSGGNIFRFSETGALRDVAHNLYAELRRVDAAGFQRIIVEAAPASNTGLTAAINDRLARAAGKRRRS